MEIRPFMVRLFTLIKLGTCNFVNTQSDLMSCYATLLILN